MATTKVGLCAKVILFIINFLLWLTGVIILAAGIWFAFDHTTFNFLTFFEDPALQNLAYGMIVVGGFITLVGFMGCFGACHERKWMMWLYFTVILLLLLAEVALTVLLYVFNEEVQTFANVTFSGLVDKKYVSDRSNPFTTAINGIQRKFNCCGVEHYSDWIGSSWHNETLKQRDKMGYTLVAPLSCCVNQSNDSQMCKDAEVDEWTQYIHNKGCYYALLEVFEEHIWIIGGIMIGVVVLQIILLMMAIVLLRNLLDDYD